MKTKSVKPAVREDFVLMSEHKKNTIRAIAIRIYSQAIAEKPQNSGIKAIVSIDAARELVEHLEEEGLL